MARIDDSYGPFAANSSARIAGASLCVLGWLMACSAPGGSGSPSPTGAAATEPAPNSSARAALMASLTAQAAPALSSLFAPSSAPLLRSSSGIVPDVGGAALEGADVTLPLHVADPVTLRDRASGTRVSFALSGASGGDARVSDGLVVYPNAGPERSHVVHRPDGNGTEDLVVFERAPAVAALGYSLDLSSVAGLRLVSNVLEFVDAGGAPRVRVGAPYVVDRSGAVHDATLSVDGCAVDTNAAAPWGRAVVPPGVSACTLRVAWDGVPASDYPVVVDPTWTTTTKAMTAARKAHTATLLEDGRVLIAGGERLTGTTTTYLKTAEFFDPATNTFAATASMTTARSYHFAALLSNGNVLVGGGASATGALQSSEVFNVTTPAFATVGSLTTARQEALAVLLASNQVLVSGGMNPSMTSPVLTTAELFDATKQSWSNATAMGFRRTGHYLTSLSDGRALAVGGLSLPGTNDTASSEFYTPSRNVWASGPTMTSARHYFAGTTFPNQKVLVAGGYQESAAKNITSAELLDITTSAWAPAGNLAQAREHHTLTALSNDAAVAAGGVVTQGETTITSYLKSAELYAAASNSWVPLPDMSIARAFHTATLLNDGRVLVTGGVGSAGATATAEFLALDKNGTACSVAATCASGNCVDGVCCESACTTTCNGCAKASTGVADGTCAPALAGKDPHSDCADDGSPTCGKNGLCDGAGACASYPASPCTPSACTTGTDCTSGFCVDGICCDRACAGTCEACAAAKKGSGTDGTCGPVKSGTDPDKECKTEGAGACAGDAVCDGNGACRVPTVGKACAKAACSDAVTAAAAATCAADGGCTPATTSCSPYKCDATSATCKTTCTADTDCAPGGKCTGGMCQLKSNGAACKASSECTSNSCTDGFCCDQACTGQCEACDVSGSEGICTKVTDPPHGSRPACDGTGTCGGKCDGSTRATCAYPAEDVSCGPAGCQNGSATTQACNGIGSCSIIIGASCAPFACGTSACETTCKMDADCASGAQCDKGVCIGATQAQCKDDETLDEADGGTKNCGAYKCELGACATSCLSNTDCAKGATCTTGKCNLPPGSSGGCGCRVGGSSTSSEGGGDAPASVAGLALLAFAWRRIRDRKRSPRRATTDTEKNR